MMDSQCVPRYLLSGFNPPGEGFSVMGIKRADEKSAATHGLQRFNTDTFHFLAHLSGSESSLLYPGSR